MDRRRARHVRFDPLPGRSVVKRLRAPFDVLIVEDEALLAMDIEAMVEDAGHQVVAESASVRELEALQPARAPTIAFVDIQLAEGSSGLDACRVIQDRWASTVIVFVTANPLKIPDDFCGAHGVIPKPFTRNGLKSAMRYIEEGLCEPPPVSPQPSSFIASPAFAASWT